MESSGEHYRNDDNDGILVTPKKKKKHRGDIFDYCDVYRCRLNGVIGDGCFWNRSRPVWG